MPSLQGVTRQIVGLCEEGELMATTIWIVFRNYSYEGYQVEALFTTEAAAQEFCDAITEDKEEYSIDKTAAFDSLAEYNQTPWQQGGGNQDS